MDKNLYRLKALERYSNLFYWKSDAIELPYNPEYFLTTNGSIGYLLKEGIWVVGQFDGLTDKNGEFTQYVWHSLNTGNVKTGTAKNHTDIVVCGNTCFYRGFGKEREWFSTIKSEIDKSIEVLTLNTRKSKAFVVENDRKKRDLARALKDVEEGKPFILTTSSMEELQIVDITDPADIERMQYLNSFYQSIEKREANDAGVDLDLLDKRAQVSNKEITQYDDVTTENYLIMYNARLRFMDEMKKNGLNIEIVRNPVFYDEPDETDVKTGEFEAAEHEEQAANPETNENGGAENESDT